MSNFSEPESNFAPAQVVPPQGKSYPGKEGSPQTSTLSIVSIVFGILSVIFSCFAGIIGLICGIIALVKINGSDGRLKGTGFAVTGIVLSCLLSFVSLLFIGMLLPAVQQVREAARRTMTMNNMRQVGLAQHNYESAYNMIPPSTENLSWRVHILPFLERSDLYERFNLDEPWDSPTNLALLPEMPEFYKSVGGQTDGIPAGMTLIQRPVGNGAFPLPGSAEDAAGVSFDQLISHETIWLVEVNPELAVEWTRPSDFSFNPDDPFAGLGDVRYGSTISGNADGSVHMTVNEMSVSPGLLKSLFTIDPNDNQGPGAQSQY